MLRYILRINMADEEVDAQRGRGDRNDGDYRFALGCEIRGDARAERVLRVQDRILEPLTPAEREEFMRLAQRVVAHHGASGGG